MSVISNNNKKKHNFYQEEKERAAAEHQRELDDLQLRLANLDLKYKQTQLDDNRELHAVKVKFNFKY